MTTLVVGIGHPDRGDDAAGPLVTERLRQTPGLVVLTVTGDLSGLLLDPRWEGAAEVVLVDAIRTGGPPGTVRIWDGAELLTELPRVGAVNHDLGVATTLQLADRLGRLPPRMTFFGIEGRGFEMGSSPSRAVLAAVEAVAAEIRGDHARAHVRDHADDT